jgi:hypothetical protein
MILRSVHLPPTEQTVFHRLAEAMQPDAIDNAGRV